MKGKPGTEKSISHWNNIKWKPDCVDIKAEEGDIVQKINKYWFVCQRKNDYNNVICYLPKNEHTKWTVAVKSMFEFIYRLGHDYHLTCVRIQGNPKRYAFVDRFFGDTTVVVKDEEENGDWVRYCLLNDEVIAKLDILRKTQL